MDSSDVIGESFALLRAWGKLNPEINHPKSKGSSLNESIRLFPELLSNTVASPDWSDWFWRVDFHHLWWLEGTSLFFVSLFLFFILLWPALHDIRVGLLCFFYYYAYYAIDTL